MPCLETENRKLGLHRKRKTVIISSKYGSVEALAHFNLSLSDAKPDHRKFKRVSVVARSMNVAPEEVATILERDDQQSSASEGNASASVSSSSDGFVGGHTPNPLTLAHLNAVSSHGGGFSMEEADLAEGPHLAEGVDGSFDRGAAEGGP